jgi:hypothetical protein
MTIQRISIPRALTRDASRALRSCTRGPAVALWLTLLGAAACGGNISAEDSPEPTGAASSARPNNPSTPIAPAPRTGASSRGATGGGAAPTDVAASESTNVSDIDQGSRGAASGGSRRGGGGSRRGRTPELPIDAGALDGGSVDGGVGDGGVLADAGVLDAGALDADAGVNDTSSL